jgi:hypothetical protein
MRSRNATGVRSIRLEWVNSLSNAGYRPLSAVRYVKGFLSIMKVIDHRCLNVESHSARN